MTQPIVAFEHFSMAREAARGTLVTPPTHKFNMKGKWTPKLDIAHPDSAIGTLAEYSGDSEIVHQYGVWDAEGKLDVWKLLFLLEMAVQSGVTPSTPSGATTARLWEYIRTMTSDDLKSGTGYWGDPGAKLFQGAFAMLDELTIKSDAMGKDLASMAVKGQSQGLAQLGSNPTLPSISLPRGVVPGRMQLWLDVDDDAFGTTEVTSRLLSVEHSIPTGVTYDYAATGPDGGISYVETGRVQVHPTTKLTLKVPDMNQMSNYQNGDFVKCRVRHNGALIETVTAVDFYDYVEVDVFGKFDSFAWGDDQKATRTIEVEIGGEYCSDISSDLRVAVQNNKTTV